MILGKGFSIRLSLLLIIAVISSLIAQASINCALIHADADLDTTINPILDFVADISAINGSAVTSYGSISSVEIQINRSDDGNCWNGSAWQDSLIWINASPTDGSFNTANESWTISKSTVPPLPQTWVKGSTYYIQARAFNGSDYDPTPATESFTIGDIGWDIMETGVGDDLFGIWGASTSDVLAVGGDPELYTYLFDHYDGSAWGISGNGSGYVLNRLWGSNASDIFAVGSGGTILHYDGISWNAMYSNSSAWLYGVWGNSSSDVFAVGYDTLAAQGVVLHWDGGNWSTVNTADIEIYDVWGSNASDVYVAGSIGGIIGKILHYDGSGWSVMYSNYSRPLYGIWGTNSSDIFAVGTGEGLGGLIIHYNGSSWNIMESNTENTLRTVWGTSSTNVFVGGDGGTILYYGGSYWIPSYSGTDSQINAFWGDVHNVYTAGKKGIILHYNAYPNSSVYLDHPDIDLTGEDFTVLVGISKTTDLYSGQFSVSYDPNIIRVVSPNVSDGILYGTTTYTVPTAGDWSLNNGSRPDKQGIITINFSLSDQVGVTVGRLAEITFRGNSSGNTSISFIPVLNLSDYSSVQIPISWYNSSIEVKKARPPAIWDLSCSTINRSAIHLNWSATGTGEVGSTYDIRFRPNIPITDTNWDYETTTRCDGEPAPNASPLTDSFDVTGLKHNTRYYFAVKLTEPGSYPSNLSTPTCYCDTLPWWHDLDVLEDPGGAGTAVPNGSSPFLHGSTVGINATPAECYQFVNWTGDNDSISHVADINASNTTITILGNYSITANFVINTSTLTYINGSNGTIIGTKIQPLNCGESGSAVTAVPNTCYHFVNWNDSSTQNPRTDIATSANLTVIANFTLTQYTLNISSGGNGSATPSGTTSQNCNASVPISATANSSYGFLNWSGDTASITNPNAASTTIFMNGSKTIQANFIATPWDVTGDGHVNVLDMIRIGQHWGQRGAPGWIPEDVNKDGTINVLDMIVIGQHWTG